VAALLGVEQVRNGDDARACDTAAFARYFLRHARARIYLPPSQFEAAFSSLAHNDDDIDRTIQAADEALGELG